MIDITSPPNEVAPIGEENAARVPTQTDEAMSSAVWRLKLNLVQLMEKDEADDALIQCGLDKASLVRRTAATELLRAAGDLAIDRLVERILAAKPPQQGPLIELLTELQVNEVQFRRIGHLEIPPGLDEKIDAWARNLKPSDFDTNYARFTQTPIAQVGAAMEDDARPPQERSIFSWAILSEEVEWSDPVRLFVQMVNWLDDEDGGKRAVARGLYRGSFTGRLDVLVDKVLAVPAERQLHLLEALAFIGHPLKQFDWMRLSFECLHRSSETVGGRIISALRELPHFLVDGDDQPLAVAVPQRVRASSPSSGGPGTVIGSQPPGDAALVSPILQASSAEAKRDALAAIRELQDGIGLLIEQFCGGALDEEQRLVLLEAIADLQQPLSGLQYLAVSTHAVWRISGEASRVARALGAIPYVLTGDPLTTPSPTPKAKRQRQKRPSTRVD